jgi:hypothetical protein
MEGFSMQHVTNKQGQFHLDHYNQFWKILIQFSV